MFGPRFGFGRQSRRGYGRRRPEVSPLEVLLILGQQASNLPVKPPVTLALVALQCAIYYADLLLPDLQVDAVTLLPALCLQPHAVANGEFFRLFTAPLLHASDTHVCYNMASFLVKGAALEPEMGSRRFALLLLRLAVAASVIHVALAMMLSGVPLFRGEAWSCCVGFSAVLFALKTIQTRAMPGHGVVAGFSVPLRFISWAELAYIQLLNPQASWLGHGAGILAGLAELGWRKATRRRSRPPPQQSRRGH